MRTGAFAGLLVCASVPALAQTAGSQSTDAYDELFRRYLQSAREIDRAGDPTAGFDWLTGLTADPRARKVNDLVTVRVVESIVAAGSADSSLTKSSTASAAVPSLFGLERALPDWIDPGNLASARADTRFRGGGVTTRSGELSTTITARVVEVLPNRDLVLEAVREIDINGDRQIVVLTGVVRPTDIGPTNLVLSTSIGQLRIQYFGRGLIRDNLRPGWLIRVLNRIF